MIGRKFRAVARYVFYIVCFAVVLIPALACCGMVFGDGPTETEIIGLAGRKARDHIPEWPENVTETDVTAVWYKCENGLDNSTAWYRVQSSA